MEKRFILLIIFIWINNIGYSQDFKFKWEIWPSFSKSYTVRIEKTNSTSHIIIKETTANDSIVKTINQNDCDTLISFLDKYDFPIKESTIYGPKFRIYVETKLLPDKNWILIKGDSLKLELLESKGYHFDKDSNKCYNEAQMIEEWIDGNTYEGEYIKSNIKRTFSVFCARTSSMDIKLNRLVYNLMTKYDRLSDYYQLKELIESDKPIDKN